VTTGAVGQIYQYQATATDPDGDALTFELVSGPAGMVVHPKSGIVAWVPDATQAGTHDVFLQVRDARGAVAAQEFTITVAGTSSALAIVSSPPLLATVAEGYTYPVLHVPTDHDASFTLLFAPDGMVIDEDTGVITWTPDAGDVGTHLVILRAMDTFGGTAFQSYALAVRPPNQAPTINSSPVETTAAGTTYRYLVQATDPDGDALTFELLSAPEGMIIDPRTGYIVWETDTGDIGGHAIEVLVTDERGLSDSQTYTLTVEADTEAPVVVILQTTNLTIPGNMVSFQVLATDNVASRQWRRD
jgi:hypothetical protein